MTTEAGLQDQASDIHPKLVHFTALILFFKLPTIHGSPQIQALKAKSFYLPFKLPTF